MRMVETGRFVGQINRTLLNAYARRFAIKRLPIKIPTEPYPIAVVTVKNRLLTPVAQLFIDCARELGATVAPGLT